MEKLKELSDPTSCLNRARNNELLFVLLARDSVAPDVIRYWAQHRVRMGLNKPADKQIKEALECASLMEKQHPEIRAKLKELRGGKSRSQVERENSSETGENSS